MNRWKIDILKVLLLLSLIAATDAGLVAWKFLGDDRSLLLYSIRASVSIYLFALFVYILIGTPVYLAVSVFLRKISWLTDLLTVSIACLLGWGLIYQKTTRFLFVFPSLLPWAAIFGTLFFLIALAIFRSGRIRPWFISIGFVHLGLILFLLVPANRRVPTGQKADIHGPNVVLIIVDTMRYDRLGCSGYSMGLTPNIDRVAARARIYDNAHVHWPASAPSHGAILTSLPVWEHKTLNGMALNPDLRTLAEVLKDNGYITGGFVQNPMLSHRNHFDQGFDLYINEGETSLRGATTKVLRDCLLPLFLYYRILGRDRYTDEAIDWLARNRSEKTFLFLQYFFPHIPYNPPRRFMPKDGYRGPITGSLEQSRAIRNGEMKVSPEDIGHMTHLYEAEIRYADEQIGRVLDAMERSGLADNTILVITADHGENLYEHHKFFAHGNELYESTVHIPLIISLPSESRSGERHGELIQETDIMPLILTAAGISEPGITEGRPSFYRNDALGIVGITCNPEQTLLYSLFDTWKYILNYKTLEEELYDLKSDPGEVRNLGDLEPSLCSTFRKIILQEVDQNERIREFISSDLCGEEVQEPEARELLKALGYIE